MFLLLAFSSRLKKIIRFACGYQRSTFILGGDAQLSMHLQFCSSPHILLFSLFIHGDIDVNVIPGVWCCVSYPHVTPWGMLVVAIGETGVPMHVQIHQLVDYLCMHTCRYTQTGCNFVVRQHQCF